MYAFMVPMRAHAIAWVASLRFDHKKFGPAGAARESEAAIGWHPIDDSPADDPGLLALLEMVARSVD